MEQNITFNPMDWLTEKKNSMPTSDENIEKLVEAIETQQVDITGDYANWFRVGAALAAAYGEGGRSYFHRLSRFYADYSVSEADKKYDQCLRDANPSVGLGSIFHLAKQAGVTMRTSECGTPACGLEETENLGKLANVGKGLSPYLQQIMELDDDPAIQSLLLFGSVISLSAVMPNVCGIYGSKRVYGNLFGFVVAPSASSKGKLADVVRLVQPIQDEIRVSNQLEQMNYQEQMARYKAEHNPNELAPEAPKYKTLRIAANASSTALYQALNDNDGVGLTFETEGDSVSLALKSDYGNYSDGLRKAFHHEAISYMRRKDNEHVDIAHPQWSVLLSGTPAQVTSFIPNSENGLFSRFLFYCVPRTYEWMDVFGGADEPLEESFTRLGEQYLQVYHRLKQLPHRLEFKLTKDQQERFNSHFRTIQTEYAKMYGDDMIASVRRLGLICFRVAMVFSVTRYVEHEYDIPTDTLWCLDDDFESALTMVDTLMQHTAHVYSNLLTPVEGVQGNRGTMTGQLEQYLKNLPEEFTRQTYLEVAKKLMIPEKTADKYIGKLTSVYKIIQRVKAGHYKKMEAK